METTFIPVYSVPVKPEITALEDLVNRLLPRFQQAASGQNSYFINDIPAGFYIDADENLLATVISCLLGSMAKRSRNSCVRITAKRYNNIVLLRLKDANNKTADAIRYNDWRKVKPLAEKLGGCILAGAGWYDSLTVTLTFRSTAPAAG